MAYIKLESVDKFYTKGKTKVQVLSDLSLSLHSGEFTALMGPSGSGKTTLLNLIGGLDFPDSGQITVDDININQLKGAAISKWRSKNIGFIFQFYNLLPHLTAIQNVEMPLLLHDFSKKQRRNRALLALEIVGLLDREDHRPSELSGGQEQRVAIARAIVADPQIILADEPTGDLDRESAIEILELLSILNKQQNKTIIMVTHDHQAANFANKVIKLDKGSIA